MVMIVSWPFPEINQVALNVDGSSYGNPGRAGYGGLIRDHNGNWIIGFSSHLEFADSLEVELLAILTGLLLAWDIGARNISCRSDCTTALTLIMDPTPQPHQYSQIIDNIKELISRDWSISLCHTYREGNQCADQLAKLGANAYAIEGTEYFFEPPSFISPLLKSDAMKVAYTRH